MTLYSVCFYNCVCGYLLNCNDFLLHNGQAILAQSVIVTQRKVAGAGHIKCECPVFFKGPIIPAIQELTKEMPSNEISAC